MTSNEVLNTSQKSEYRRHYIALQCLKKKLFSYTIVEVGKLAANKSYCGLYKSKCFPGEEKGAIPRLTGGRGESTFFPTKESEATALIKNSVRPGKVKCSPVKHKI